MDKYYGIIYKATNKINRKIYIGQTVKFLHRRISSHISNAMIEKECCYFHSAINKYGPENFKWEIITKCYSCEELNRKEKLFIKKYNTFKNGYNLTEGGKGSAGFEHTAETKRKISSANKGKIRSEEFKKKVSEAMRGKKHPMYGRYGENNPRFGKKHSEETKKKMSVWHKGKKLSEEHKKKLSNTKCKNYKIIAPNGEEFIVHGLRNFCRNYSEEKLHHANLIKVAQGRSKHCKGYRCEYLEAN
jgi:group I intron endonuclease